MSVHIFCFFLIFSHTVLSSSPFHHHRYSLHTNVSSRPKKPDEYFEISSPTPADSSVFPTCATQSIIRHSFANTLGSPPFSSPYIPPRSCPGPWARVILELSISSRGDQNNRIAAVWIGGVELLRTSTAQPTKYGIFWKVRKDVTRYSTLLSQRNLSITMMLENIVNRQLTGVYHVNALLYFYNKTNTLQSPTSTTSFQKQSNELGLGLGTHINGGGGSWGFYGPPADMIIPVSSNGVRGFWFRIDNETDIQTKRIKIPKNTRQAVLELYVSHHGDDEFWYSNPPDAYIQGNNLTSTRGGGSFREIHITIDGNFVESEIPFPVIFTGGINPFFWQPIVGIGTFDLPTYDINLTPVLDTIIDGKEHEFGITVSHGISFWLVNANLHLWLDTQSEAVAAKSMVYDVPAIQLKQSTDFHRMDGSFHVVARRKTQFIGWVMTNEGNLTTILSKEFKFKNQITIRANGTLKEVKQKVKVRRQVRIKNSLGQTIARAGMKRQFPLTVSTISTPTETTQTVHTNITHGFKDKFTDKHLKSNVQNTQTATGWVQLKGDNVVCGSANTQQTYAIKDQYLCYFRDVASINGKLVGDNATTCASASGSAADF